MVRPAAIYTYPYEIDYAFVALNTARTLVLAKPVYVRI